MIPTGSRAAISSTGMSWGTISEYTRHSRTRRAISCAYWAPKSITSTGRCGGGASASAAPDASAWLRCCVNGCSRSTAHPDRLLALQLLALRLERRREHDLCLLEGLNRLVSGRRHGCPKRAHQVQRAVVLLGRADHDLLERRHLV